VTVRTIPRFWHPRTGITAFLLHLPTTAELVVLNLIPQHSVRKQGSDVIQSTIINQLLKADLVIADLTDHNPNVLFEGISHKAVPYSDLASICKHC
jgi:hypothetical protein